jgi:mono/diheme cytochrome c family protein
MKTMGIVFAVGMLFVAMSVGSADAADGAALFAQKCAACHGQHGEGTKTGPAQKGNEFILKSSLDEIKNVILHGRSGSAKRHPEIPIDMPAGLATEEEAGLLAQYLKGDLQK